MSVIKNITPPRASLLPGIFPEITPQMRAQARDLTPSEFAGDLSQQLRETISERTVQNWCDSGVIDAYRLGGRWRIPATELQRFGSRRASA